MFTNESTENLLDNLEIELTEVIEVENPKKNSNSVEIKDERMPPIPAKRNHIESSENLVDPIPAARRLQSLDKSEKNDENEIIQLSSMSSSVSESRKNISHNTVVAKERKAKPNNHKVFVVQEIEAAQSEETFHVIKHGKWAQDEKLELDDELIAVETECNEPIPSTSPLHPPQMPHFEVVYEKPKKNSEHQKSLSSTSPSLTTVESSNESSSSSEESLKHKKKVKETLKGKKKKKPRKQKSSSDEESSTESSVKDNKENPKTFSDQTIGNVLDASRLSD